MASSRGIHRILVGESERVEQTFLMHALTQLGHYVDVCDNAEAAEELLREGSYSVLIMDLGLPRANGMEMLRDLRAQGHQPGVIFTALAPRQGDAEACGEYDRVKFLQKPFTVEELQLAISEVTPGVLA